MKLCRAGGVRLLNDNLLKNHFQYPLKSLKVSRFASYFHVEFGSPISYWVQLRPWAFLHLAVTDLQPDLGVCPSYGCWHIGRRLRACLGCWRGQKWKKKSHFSWHCQVPVPTMHGACCRKSHPLSWVEIGRDDEATSGAGFCPQARRWVWAQDVPIKLKLEVERCGGNKLGYSEFFLNSCKLRWVVGFAWDFCEFLYW